MSRPPAEAQAVAWHSAMNDVGELRANAPDERYAKRAASVESWIKANRPAPPSAPVGVPPALTPEQVHEMAPDGLSWDETGAWAMGYEACRQRALAQQPAAVDGAMVERALNARYNGYDVACFIDEKADGRGVIRAALTAALAAQQGGAE